MTILELISESPYLTAFLIWGAFSTVFRIWNRFMRHLNIRKHGWPPPHCDADGDFKPEEDEKEETP